MMKDCLVAFLLSSTSLFLTTAFVVLPQARQTTKSSSLSSIKADDFSLEGEKRRRLAEFFNLHPLPESELRRERLERENQNRIKYAKYGNELWQLRTNIAELSDELLEAIGRGEEMEELGLRSNLSKVEKRDPELVYKVELEAMAEAEADGRVEDALFHKERAINARSCLPHFNLEGLWVGKYGSHGYEMINVTYAGDTLVAFKVTGDKNVPRGEITFQADLSPLSSRRPRKSSKMALEPIMLTDKAAKKWGTTQLPRYHGLGRVAEEGFLNSQWMEGQFIVIGEEYFSFAWVPIEHQIFFGRPSAELALKMLRDDGVSSFKVNSWNKPPSTNDDVTVWKAFAAHCLERTEETIEEELFGNEFSCIWHGMDTEECYFQ